MSNWIQPAAIAGILVFAVMRGAENINYRWQWYRVDDFLFTSDNGAWAAGPLVQGLFVTLEISVLSLILTLVIGLATALLRLSSSVVGRGLARGYLELIRNTPLLIQLYVMYFVLGPILGWGQITTAISCLAAFQGAYTSEIFRAGLRAIPRGQVEAGESLGLTRLDNYRYVILPQVLRNMLPPLTNEAVSLVKNSSIVSVIAIFDLTTQGRNLIADTFLTFEIWLTVAAIYLAVTLALSTAAAMAERRRVGA
ncbi:MAG: amino acid ABC transporter permease [Gemmatimonadota bacterium]|nr:amino acid ABC transporter permease [Gemmatimonadota bacterium]